MGAVALLLLVLSFTSHGRRLRIKGEQVQGTLFEDHQISKNVYNVWSSSQSLSDWTSSSSRVFAGAINPLRALAALLSTECPAFAWQIVGHSNLAVGNPQLRGNGFRFASNEANRIADKSTRTRVTLGMRATEHPAGNTNQVWHRKSCRPSLWFAAAVVTLIATASRAVAVGDAASAVPSGTGDFHAVLQKSFKEALGGGFAGAIAALIQVLSLCWLNTALTYQYRYGGDLRSALTNLTKEGGIPRLYQGLLFALIEVPLMKFGVTASNAGVRAFLGSTPATADLPPYLAKAAVSLTAGLWRILCNPVSTFKVTLQAKGLAGLQQLQEKMLQQGLAPLYKGCVANYGTTVLGLFPWLMTFDYLNGIIPSVSRDMLFLFLFRNAFLGFAASCVSAVITNFLRVIKTTQQTESLSIVEAVNMIVEKDGIIGLFGRGLRTMILLKAIQESVFTAIWRYLEAVWQVQYK